MTHNSARLQAILDTVVDAIITIDERGLIESVNRAAVRIFGYAPEEMVGRNVSVLMPEPYRSAHDGYLRRYLETGERRIVGIGREVVGRVPRSTEVRSWLCDRAPAPAGMGGGVPGPGGGFGPQRRQENLLGEGRSRVERPPGQSGAL